MSDFKGNNSSKLLVGIGSIAIASYVVSSLFDALFERDDTINYELKYRGRKVYHGLCYEDRLDARLNEHLRSGKKFDLCIYDDAKPRIKASLLERKRIRRDRTKYNVHHKFIY